MTGAAVWLPCAARGAAPLLLPTNEFEPCWPWPCSRGDELLREGGRYGNFRSNGFQRRC